MRRWWILCGIKSAKAMFEKQPRLTRLWCSVNQQVFQSRPSGSSRKLYRRMLRKKNAEIHKASETPSQDFSFSAAGLRQSGTICSSPLRRPALTLDKQKRLSIQVHTYYKVLSAVPLLLPYRALRAAKQSRGLATGHQSRGTTGRPPRPEHGKHNGQAKNQKLSSRSVTDRHRTRKSRDHFQS